VSKFPALCRILNGAFGPPMLQWIAKSLDICFLILTCRVQPHFRLLEQPSEIPLTADWPWSNSTLDTWVALQTVAF
jgi:hypothetical protein